MIIRKLVERLAAFGERTRHSFGRAQGLPLLSLLGFLCGLLAGLIVILFRVAVEYSQMSFLPGGMAENYEALAPGMRVLLAGGGGLLLGLLFFLVSRQEMRVGVIHVMERLTYHEGHLPLKHALMQFLGGVISLVSGHSLGREGPSVHLGAAGASLLGRRLHLPNNSIRTLVGCGVAGAIAASFNTPLAGVIFAMEVVMMEYTIIGFTPVILAAVGATALNHAIFDRHPAFHVPALELASSWELPAILLMGVVVGGLAAAFVHLVEQITRRTKSVPVMLRMAAGGFLVGLCALAAPEIMGIGYDTVDLALMGGISLAGLVLVLLVKLVATAVSVGSGLPAGLIGPSLFMGAAAGGVTGFLVNILPGQVSPPGLYVMLGMGAMMGATLQAPLAALIALLELTGNERIIFPAMLAIVSASLAAKELFGQGSVYLAQMRSIGLDFRNDPFAQSLRRFAVSSVMNQSLVVVSRVIMRAEAERLLAGKPEWLVIRRDEGNLLLPAADLARSLEESEAERIDLLEIPGKRLQLASVWQQATLQYALNILDQTDAEALYVVRPLGISPDRIFGIVTRQDIDKGYRLRDSHGLY